ncbi:MAG TPA: sigma-70 family RNA polymerase sigma factor [Pseudonocardia sp.]|nr:sigma-70 family RNA polymerase sigma factor [Pseudonocardia sp.]
MTELATVGDTAVPPTGEDAPWEQYRRELRAYCYRMLGSSADAEDAVQDTMVRAWKGFDRFEGRSALRSWLYRIATNVCLTMLEGRNRRARPMDMGPVGSATADLKPPLTETTWVEPVPDERVLPTGGDPADVAVSRESIRLAFVAALQHLPPRQRAVLILREVLQWRAAEVAELLDTTVASVNSALQRARATLADQDLDERAPAAEMDQAHTDLLERYADAFQRYDMTALVALLHEDVVMSMPPYDLWLRGTESFTAWMTGKGCECEGSRLVPISANGRPGFGQYRRHPEGGYLAWAVQVLEISDGRVAELTSFLDTATLFPMFGLPIRLDEDGAPVTG